MRDKSQIEQELDTIIREYGGYSYDIPLPYDIWTNDNLKIPHTRLKRLFQVVNDLLNKPVSSSRILDLGCLDGIFSIEFALHGAETVGVEIREANIKKAIFCKEVLELSNLEFRQDDVRNISIESYGKFDAIICSGILYHLPAINAIDLINTMYQMTNRLVVIDTHVALKEEVKITHDGNEYWGSILREHADNANPDEKEAKKLASADNNTSFWFTRPSLMNIINDAGYSSVYECFTPIHLNYGRPGVECYDRCTIVAVKNSSCDIKTSPVANEVNEKWPEGTLTYSASLIKKRNILQKIIAKLKRMASGK